MSKRKEYTCGIYKIVNTVNNKVYVGQSVEIERRWKRHKRELNDNKHGNDYLQRAWNKHDKKNFRFEIIEICKEEELNKREMFWIAYYNSNDYKYGYNNDSGGGVGRIRNEEIRKKIGESRQYPIGEDCTNSKLTKNKVVEIKKLLYEGILNCREIGKKFNVGEHIIYNIKNGKTYVNIKTEYDEAIKNIIPINSFHHNLKLKNEEIIEIKKIFATTDCMIKNLAEVYNVDNSVISNILHNKSWRHLKTEYDTIIKEKLNKIENSKKKTVKLTIEEVIEIKKLIEKGETNSFIAKNYNVDPSSISNIRHGKSFKDVKAS